MFNARRTYAYLVSAISLAAILSAIVWLLRDVLIDTHPCSSFEVSLIIAFLLFGVPVYVGHWLWQQRLASQSVEERSALGRRIYFYVVIAAMVSQIAAQGYDLARLVLGVQPALGNYGYAVETHSFLYYAIPFVLAAFVLLFHVRLLRAEVGEAPETGSAGTVRRLYIYGFSAAGLTMIALALIELVRWSLSQIGVWAFSATPLDVEILPEMARLVIGIPLWLFHWQWANQLFHHHTEERESTLRKFYLYATIFIGTVGAVSTTATLLAGVFRQMLGLQPEGELRDALALIISFAVVWLYHSLVLRQDLKSSEDTEQQAEMKRLYLYLLAAVGLVALVAGVTWDIYLLISSATEGMSRVYREQLAYSSAAIVAGLPVWLLAWRQAQQEVGRTDASGRQARASMTRKIYIYFFQFVSMMAVLGSAIYVVSQVVNWLLTQRPIDTIDIALPIAISGVNLLVWLYHWTTLRSDRSLSSEDETQRIEDMRLVLLQKSGDRSVLAINNWLEKVSPNSSTVHVYADVDHMEQPASQWLPNLVSRIAVADAIVVPSTIFALQAGDGEVTHQLAQAIAASPARKLMLPVASPGWVWLGTEAVEETKVAEEAIETLRQIATGESVHKIRRLGCGTIGLLALGVLLFLIMAPTAYFLYTLF